MVSALSILTLFANVLLQACSLKPIAPVLVNVADEETAVVPFQTLMLQMDSNKMSIPTSVRMSPAEIKLFRDLLGKATSYLEFGAGGSTILASSFKNIKRIDVVESDPDWVEGIKAQSDVQQAVSAGKLHFHLVDIGPTKEWGYPVDQSKESAFHNYSDAGQTLVDSLGTDLVLVDGRFRVACFLKSLKASKPQTVIAIHDYTSRPGYHVVEGFADVMKRSEELVVFRKKSDCNEADLERAISNYSMNSK